VGDAASAAHCRDGSSLQLCGCCRSEVAASTASAAFTDFVSTEAHPYLIAISLHAIKLLSAGAGAVLEFQQDMSADEVQVPTIPSNC
jgi:hypothetical protein